jgi:hypothetical protein
MPCIPMQLNIFQQSDLDPVAVSLELRSEYLIFSNATRHVKCRIPWSHIGARFLVSHPNRIQCYPSEPAR